MSEQPTDDGTLVRQALNSAVASHGVSVLGDPQALGAVATRLLPGLPRGSNLLVAAARADVASLLRQRLQQEHLDTATAVQLVARELARQTAIETTACEWVTAEFARALGYPAPGSATTQTSLTVTLHPWAPAQSVSSAPPAPSAQPSQSAAAAPAQPPTQPAPSLAQPVTEPAPSVAQPAPAAHVQPAQPTAPAAHFQPVQPAAPVAPAQPAAPAAPASPAQPAAPYSPPWPQPQQPGAGEQQPWAPPPQPVPPQPVLPQPVLQQPGWQQPGGLQQPWGVPAQAAQPPVQPPPQQVWQPGVPSPGPAPRGGPGNSWRAAAIAMGAVAVLLLAYVGIAAGTHIFPFAHSSAANQNGPGPSPSTSKPTASPSVSPTPGLTSLSDLLPQDIDDPTTMCQTLSPPFNWSMTGVVQALGCSPVPGLPNGTVFAFQLDTVIDYETAWNNYNQWQGFGAGGVTVDETCPPANANDQGTEPYTNYAFPERAGQVLECGVGTKNEPIYTWTLPTENTFIVAQGAPNMTLAAMQTWWTNNGAPASLPTPTPSASGS